MPLQILRGTDTQRQEMIGALAPGELLFATDTEKLYIGDGNTIGGVLASGVTTNEAKDAAAQIFTSGIHQGISFTYNTLTRSITASVGNIITEGSIVADSFVGSLLSEDSTLLVDAVNGTIVGPVVSNLTGSVFSDDSTLLIDGVNGNIVGPIASTGLADSLDTKGFSIISTDDEDITLAPDAGRSVIINGSLGITGDINKTGTLNILSSALTSFGSNISGINGNVRILRNNYSSTFGQGFVYAQHHETQDVVPLSLVRTRNTGSSPTAVQDNDEIANIEFYGHDGTLIREVCSIRAVVDGIVTTGSIPGRIEFRTSNGGASVGALLDSSNVFKVDFIEGLTSTNTTINGNITGNVTIEDFLQLSVYADDAERLASISTPLKGMIIFMENGTTPLASNQIQYFNGTSWITL